jgi:thioredoxin 2
VAIAEYFRIQTIPTLSFIHRQREVVHQVGVLYHADLRRWRLVEASPE